MVEEDEDVQDQPPPPRDYRHGFEDFVRENPIAAVVGALVAGILLARVGIL